jgi:microcystin-dependent protein
MLTEEIRNVIVRAGITPDAGDLTQLSQAIMAGQHPVGSIYMSMDPTSPETLFGGRWTQIKDRVLVGAGGSYSVGATGGSTSVTLSLANLPRHSHGVTVSSDGAHGHSGSALSAGAHTHTRGSMEIRGAFMQWKFFGAEGAFYGNGGWGSSQSHDGGGDPTFRCEFAASRSWSGATSSSGAHTHGLSINSAGSHSHTVTIADSGSGTAFNIMPPYLAAYMWYRTA